MQSRTIIFHLKACEVVLLIESGMLRNKTPKDFCRKFLSKHFFFNFLFLLGIFLCSETFWIYHVESAVSTMLLILSNSQHSVLIACRTVSKKALGENQEIKQCQQNKGKQYFYFFFQSVSCIPVHHDICSGIWYNYTCVPACKGCRQSM